MGFCPTTSRSLSPSNQAGKPKDGRDNKDVLILKQNHVTFEAPNHGNSVFFDECNCDIISLSKTSDSKTKVLFQSTKNAERYEFLLPVGSHVLSTKMNSSRSIIVYQVDRRSVEFFNVISSNSTTIPGSTTSNIDERKGYSQVTRTKNSKILGFIWVDSTNLVMITDLSVELYHIDASKNRSRFIKSFQSASNWFVYQPNLNEGQSLEYSVLMVSTGFAGNSIQPYLFNRGQIFKLERFIVDGIGRGVEKLILSEQSITIAYIYGFVRLLVLQHESLNLKSRGAQILIYTLDQESYITTKTHTLDLDINGRFAINVIDNLVIAHDQPSKSSFIFDLMVESTEKSDCPKHFVSIMSRPIWYQDPSGASAKLDTYSVNWVFFQPSFIIDVKLGVLCTLHLNLEAVDSIIHERGLLLDFLALRSDSDHVMLSISRDIVKASLKVATSGCPHPKPLNALADVSSTFEVLSRLVAPIQEIYTEEVSTSEKATQRPSPKYSFSNRESILQDDVYRDVLKQLDTEIGKVS